MSKVEAARVVVRVKQALKRCEIPVQCPLANPSREVAGHTQMSSEKNNQDAQERKRPPQTSALDSYTLSAQAQQWELQPNTSDLETSDLKFLLDMITNSRVCLVIKNTVAISDCVKLIGGTVLYVFFFAMCFHFNKELGPFACFLSFTIALGSCLTYATWKSWRLAFPLVMRKQKDGKVVNALPSKTKKLWLLITAVLMLAVAWPDALAFEACVFGRFGFGLLPWFGSLPYEYAKHFPIFIVGPKAHDAVQDGHDHGCATGYHFCNSSTNDNNITCCDINDDCRCDDVCGADLAGWECKKLAPTNWNIPNETGYNKSLGCSYRCSSASTKICIRAENSSSSPVNKPDPTWDFLAFFQNTDSKCKWDKKVAAEQETCSTRPAAAFTRHLFTLAIWIGSASLHRHGFVGNWRSWVWLPCLVYVFYFWRWILASTEFARICKKWGCIGGDQFGLELRGKGSELDASEAFADAM
jgi:hypothetical protein